MIFFLSDMPSPVDPADFSKLRSVEPINDDPNAAPPSTWDKMKQNFSLLVQVTKSKPISETVCMKEAFIFGIKKNNSFRRFH